MAKKLKIASSFNGGLFRCERCGFTSPGDCFTLNVFDVTKKRVSEFIRENVKYQQVEERPDVEIVLSCPYCNV